MMQLGNWSSATHQLTIGLPQGSPLSPVLYNVYTKGMANGLSRVLTPADDGLIYKTRQTQGAAEAVQQQLKNVSQWCQDTGSLINPNKAQTPWCTLDHKAAGKAMPAVTFDRAVVKRTSLLRYLGSTLTEC